MQLFRKFSLRIQKSHQYLTNDYCGCSCTWWTTYSVIQHFGRALFLSLLILYFFFLYFFSSHIYSKITRMSNRECRMPYATFDFHARHLIDRMKTLKSGKASIDKYFLLEMLPFFSISIIIIIESMCVGVSLTARKQLRKDQHTHTNTPTSKKRFQYKSAQT